MFNFDFSTFFSSSFASIIFSFSFSYLNKSLRVSFSDLVFSSSFLMSLLSLSFLSSSFFRKSLNLFWCSSLSYYSLSFWSSKYYNYSIYIFICSCYASSIATWVCSSLKLESWQSQKSHTRWRVSSFLDSFLRFWEHLSHTDLKHFRQWCRLTPFSFVKFFSQSSQLSLLLKASLSSSSISSGKLASSASWLKRLLELNVSECRALSIMPTPTDWVAIFLIVVLVLPMN